MQLVLRVSPFIYTFAIGYVWLTYRAKSLAAKGEGYGNYDDQKSSNDTDIPAWQISLIPLVMVSPLDADLIRGGGEERRRLMDQIISQGNRQYLDALIRYNKALEQRNSMIKNDYRDPLLYETVEQVMDSTATSMAMDNDIPVIVFALADPQNIARVLRGEKIGTLVH